MNSLAFLQHWYSRQCNGDWEHGFGVKLSTLDNPGWTLSIRLDETDLEDRSFVEVAVERSETDWLRCWVQNKVFEARCGALQLEEVLKLFAEWADLQERCS